jgi:hypothetical protein
MKPSTLPALVLVLALAACKGDDTDTDPGDTDPVDQLLFVAPNDPVGVQLPNPSDYDYYIAGQFTMDGVLGGIDGVTYADDPSLVCTSGCEADEQMDGSTVLYPVDNAWGYIVQDYSDALVRERDGVYGDGWIGTITDGTGAPMGLSISSAETALYRVPANKGTWCAGLQDSPVKCSTEHYVTMEHLKTCSETIPYWFSDPVTGVSYPEYDACEPLSDDLDIPVEDLIPDENSLAQWAVGPDYGVSVKDDGKVLYRFGDIVKKPTDMRVVLTLPLPEEWKVPGAVYNVTRARLAVVHAISNNPNDQIRPEDYENEGATGRLPRYEEDADGRWLSTVDCYEGDGNFIPAGTVLKNPPWADPMGLSSDLREGFTNAWYRTLDRDPFEWDEANGDSPRWRMKAPKFGQDLPGFEIPLQDCAPPPLQNGEKKYERGMLTTTVLDLLDFGDNVNPLATSTGWMEPGLQPMLTADLTENGVRLTDDFDLSVYVKGEAKAMQVYSAHLYLDYELAQ